MTERDHNTTADTPADIPSSHDEKGSPVLCTVAKFAATLTLLVSLIIFYQGHNLPGGGFIGGVLAAAAGAMVLLGWGANSWVARIAWWRVSVVGLLISLTTGVVLMFVSPSGDFMDHITLHWPIHLPTATFFDLGVYLIVIGTLMTVFVELGKEEGR